MTYVVGVYGLKMHSENAYQVYCPSVCGGSANALQNYGGTQNTVSCAIFGQSEFKITPKLTFISGLRYSYDDKDYEFTPKTDDVVDFLFNPTLYPSLANQTFQNYSRKLGLTYQPDRNTFLYASTNRGAKAGGFGVQAFAPIDPASIPYKQEILTSYEAGFKLTLFDRTTHLNASLFHYDYHNYQAFSIVDLSEIIFNKQGLENGVEVDVNSRPIRGLYFQGFFTGLSNKIYDVILTSGLVVSRPMPQVPHLSLGAMGSYKHEAGPGDLTLMTDWKYDSALYFSTFNAPVDYQAPKVVGNLRLSYAPTLPAPMGGRYELAIFINGEGVALSIALHYSSDTAASAERSISAVPTGIVGRGCDSPLFARGAYDPARLLAGV